MSRIGKMSPSELIMIGKRTAKKLETLNIHTIEQLASADRQMLRYHFGIIADNMIDSALGIEHDEVKRYDNIRVPKSVSNGTTTPRDIKDGEEAKIVIYALSEMVATRLRKYNLVANGISLSIKDPQLKWVSRQAPLESATSNASDLAKAAMEQLIKMHDFNDPLRAITVCAIRLCDRKEIQLSLFDEQLEKTDKLEQSIDKIRGKYGYNAVKRGLLLDDTLTQNLHDDDDFRPFHQSKTT